jgi:hypothetical protein
MKDAGVPLRHAPTQVGQAWPAQRLAQLWHRHFADVQNGEEYRLAHILLFLL